MPLNNAATYNYPTVIVKLADQTVNNSTVLVDDNELQFWAGANDAFLIKLLPYFSSSTVADIKIGVSVPAGGTARFLRIQKYVDATPSIDGADTTDQMKMNGAGAGVPRQEGLSQGIFINGATAGYFKIQFAQNVAEVSDTIMKANSILEYLRI